MLAGFVFLQGTPHSTRTTGGRHLSPTGVGHPHSTAGHRQLAPTPRLPPVGKALERRATEDKPAEGDAGGGDAGKKDAPKAEPWNGYAKQTRQITATLGLPPYGQDCCPCLANEEDYRVYPVTPALLQTGEAAEGRGAAAAGAAAAAGGAEPRAPAPAASAGAAPATARREGAAALLELEQGPGMLLPGQNAGLTRPSSLANRMAYSLMGTPPYGMDCCACLSNEEDYRVYPSEGGGGAMGFM